jgi:hypothetical protein
MIEPSNVIDRNAKMKRTSSHAAEAMGTKCSGITKRSARINKAKAHRKSAVSVERDPNLINENA